MPRLQPTSIDLQNPVIDALLGDGGANTLNGGPGADTLSGLGGTDVLNGNDGDDTLYGYDLGAVGAINATTVANGFSSPVAASSTPGDPGFIYVVEKDTGVIWRTNVITGAHTVFLDIVDSQFLHDGERGVLGIAFHPDYATNGRFFVYLTDAQGDLQVREYHRSANPAVADTTATIIWETPHPTFNNHNGGWIAFSPTDGFLYIATGDGGSGGDPDNHAQDLNSLLGKILRIDVNSDDFPADAARNYHVPAGNPFVGVAGADEIWAYGLRNPYRNAFDPRNGDLYIADVGQSAREEVDYLHAGQAGANLGWRIMEGNLPFNPGPPGTPQPGDPSLTNPIFDYGRTVGSTIIGGEIYTGSNAGFVGQFLFSDFGSGRFFSLSVNGGVAVDPTDRTAQLTGASMSQVVEYVTDNNGALYAIGIGGTVWRLDFGAGAEDVGDTLNGGAGNDSLTGNAGADNLNGGLDIDTANYSIASTTASWHRNPDGAWTINAGVDGTDTVSNVEFLHFTDRDVHLDRPSQTFSGDGASDVLFRNTSGSVVSWNVNGTTLSSSAQLATVAPAQWTPLGAGDLDGDGRDDILWRSANNGSVYSWQMNGAVIASVGAIAGLGAEWSFLGAGDFNGDGRDDLAWRNGNNGVVYSWDMSGATTIGSAGAVAALGAEWSLQGVGDFNGDGRDDFLWRNASGATYIWTMNDRALSAAATSVQAGNAWHVEGVGDFNGDGRDDILWRNDNGSIATWSMNGSTASQTSNIGSVGAEWHIMQVGDYNGDGRDDILWQNDNGVVYVWMLNGATVLQAGAIASVGAEWGII